MEGKEKENEGGKKEGRKLGSYVGEGKRKLRRSKGGGKFVEGAEGFDFLCVFLWLRVHHHC